MNLVTRFQLWMVSYISDENKIKVEGGVVTEIETKEPEDEPMPAPETEPAQEVQAAEEPATEPAPETEPATEPVEEPKDDKVAELETRIADLEAKLAELESKLAEIATTPAAQPVMDEFENIKKIGKTGDSLDKVGYCACSQTK